MKYISILLLIALSGCLTSKHADKKLSQIFDKYPDKVAQMARDSFPCVDVLSDTVIETRDSLIRVDCGDTTLFIIDTTLVPFTKIRTKFIEVKAPLQTITITKFIEDSAKIKLMQSEINRLNNTIVDKDKMITSISTKLSRRSHTMWWLLAVCVTFTLSWVLYLWLKSK